MTLATIRQDMGTPRWVLRLMEELDTKDVVDVANVLEVLAQAYSEQAAMVLR